MAHLQENFTGKVFVVFHSKSLRQRILATENRNKSCGQRILMKCTCGLVRADRIEVNEPAEPSDIIWENLHITSRERCIRTALTTVLSFLLILGCFLAVFFVSRFKIDRIDEVKEVAVEESK